MGRVKVQDHERIDDAHVEKVIAHLDAGKPKKEAYDILNIKSNPTRLSKIIQEYHDRKATEKRIRQSKRGTEVTNSEIQTIIDGSLEGTSITAISKEIFRSTQFVANVIERIGIPRKGTGSWWDRRFETSIPDLCVSDSFDKYEIVWSDKYNGLAIVLGQEDTVHIYVIEKIEEEAPFSINGKVYTGYGGFHAWQQPEELASLKHLKQYGVDISRPYKPHFRNWL